MLGKLLKYELKHTARYIVMIIIGLLVVTPVSALYVRFYTNWDYSGDIHMIFTMLFASLIIIYAITLIGAGILTMVLLVQRFYKSTVSGEGYLTHTLPVSKSNIIISKLLIYIFWEIVIGLVIVLSLVSYALIVKPDFFSPHVREIIRNILFDGLMPTKLMGVLFILATLFSIAAKALMIFASIGIGHSFNNHPVLGSVLSYFAISTILQIISSVGTGVIMTVGMNLDFLNNLTTQDIQLIAYAVMNIATLAEIAIFYFITLHMFEKKLNI